MAAHQAPPSWDSPGENTGVGCHFLLQYMKVKSQSEVTQSCPTLSDPMDCSLPGSSIHGIFQERVLEWDAIAFSTIMYKINSKDLQHSIANYTQHLVLTYNGRECKKRICTYIRVCVYICICIYVYTRAPLVAQMLKESVCKVCRRPGFNPWVEKTPCIYNWITLLYTWKYHNTANQVYFNKN